MLVLAGGSLVATAGCLGDGGDDPNETTDGSTSDDATEPDETDDGTGSPDRTDNGTGQPNETDGDPNETDGPNSPDEENGGESEPRGMVRDLTITGQSAPATVAPETGLLTAVTLANAGAGNGEVSLTATLRQSGGQTVAEETTTPTLAAGSETTISLTGTPDALLGQAIREANPGTYELVATTAGEDQTAQVTVQTPATPALSTLNLGEMPVTTDRTELSPTVRLANTGDIAGIFDLTLRLERADDSSVRREATASQQVTPGDEARLTIPVDIDGLAPGTYRVTVTAAFEDAPAREATVTGELSVEQAPGELDITVYTQAADDEYEARAGTLRVREQGADEPLLTHDLSDSPSVTVPSVATGDELLLTTENIDDGVYPDGEQTVTVEGTTEVEFVTAYEFRGADSFRLSAYLFAPNPSPPDVIDPSANYYVWATHAADDDHYIRWYRVAGGTTYDFDDSIHNHGVDLRQFQQSGRFAPVEQVRIGGEAYGHRYGSGALADEQSWNRLENDSPAYDPENLGRENFGPIYPHHPLTRLTGATPEKQQFAGPVEINDQTFHQYDIAVKNYPDSRAFVEPETGYVMRFETEKTYAGPSEQGYEIWTYSDHGTINSLSLLELDFGGAEPPL
jgi:hypothetical protein